MNTKVSNSIVITRLRTGETLSFVLRSSRAGIPFAQFVDTNSGEVTPSWTEEAKQPWLTPDVASASGQAVTLTGHRWKYQGEELIFDGTPDSGGWASEHNKRFAIRASDGTIKPIANLANKKQPADATLEYIGTATIGGKMSQPVGGIYTVRISPSGSSAFILNIDSDRLMLDNAHTTAELIATLMTGTGEVSGAEFSWKINKLDSTAIKGKKCTINRDMVDYMAVVMCEASVEKTVVARSSVYVYDNADEYILEPYATGGTVLGSGTDTTIIKARLYKAADNSEIKDISSLGKASWKFTAYDHEKAESFKTSTDNSITITTAEMDAKGVSALDVVVTLSIS